MHLFVRASVHTHSLISLKTESGELSGITLTAQNTLIPSHEISSYSPELAAGNNRKMKER